MDQFYHNTSKINRKTQPGACQMYINLRETEEPPRLNTLRSCSIDSMDQKSFCSFTKKTDRITTGTPAGAPTIKATSRDVGDSEPPPPIPIVTRLLQGYEDGKFTPTRSGIPRPWHEMDESKLPLKKRMTYRSIEEVEDQPDSN